MGNTNIFPVKNIKYLGLNFTSNFRFNAHVDYLITKANKNYYLIKKYIHSNYIDPKIKTNVYKTYLRSIFQYASPAWFNTSNISSFQIEKIRKFERKMLRASTNSHRKRNNFKFIRNSELYERANTNRIDIHLLKISINFHEKCRNSANSFLRGLVEPFRENSKHLACNHLFHLYEENNDIINNFLEFNRSKNDTNVMVYMRQ